MTAHLVAAGSRSIVLLLRIYHNREDSECTVIASGFCEAISWLAGRLLRRKERSSQ